MSGTNPTVSPQALPHQPIYDNGPLVSYTPAQIRAAYGFNQATLPNGAPANGAGQTIAIVDPYHDPTILSDLGTFSSYFGLPGASASVVSFTPTVIGSWATETALDVEWTHAAAPGATLLLVEAASSNLTDLMAAVQYANTHGASVVSMSWGSSEFAGESGYDSYFSTPGVTYVASAGDSGTTQYPAVSPNVVAVGGTTLQMNSTGGYGSESAWSNSGGGTSLYESQPSYQQGLQSTGKRTTPDVAANANPNTGYVVYDMTGIHGWGSAGGTSAGAPLWAGIFAMANQARAVNGLTPLGQGQAALAQLPSSSFHDITTGGNGTSTAGPGYDQVTGRGSPIVPSIVSNLATATQPPPASSGGGSSSPAPNTSSQIIRVKSHDIVFSIGITSTGSVSVDVQMPTQTTPTPLTSNSTNGANTPTLLGSQLGLNPSAVVLNLFTLDQMVMSQSTVNTGLGISNTGTFGVTGFRGQSSSFESPLSGGDATPTGDGGTSDGSWEYFMMDPMPADVPPTDGGTTIESPSDGNLFDLGEFDLFDFDE